MSRSNKVSVVLLLFLSAFLYACSANVVKIEDLNEANALLSTTDGDATKECDCGPYGLCSFDNDGIKKCKCAPMTIEFDGRCLECDCGKFSKSCSYSTNGTKVCQCDSLYVVADGHCTECDCGVHGLCKIEFGRKKCICGPNFIEVNGKCQACDCGEATYSCILSSSREKQCTCFSGYEADNGTCSECNCGQNGRCSFENGLRKCMCNLYYSEKNGTCEFCTCGENSNFCNFDRRGVKVCNCASGYAEKDGACKECNCGSYGSCSFEYGIKKCKCKPFAVARNGLCVIMATTTEPPTTKRATILTSTTQACDCGENSFACHRNMKGDRICDCFCGYLANDGYCEECNCGPYGGCGFENGRKKCICRPFAVEVNGVCVDFGTTSEGTTYSSTPSTMVPSTTQNICSEDKCVNGKCENVGNGFICRCNYGFTGQSCEEIIQCKSNIQDIWMIMLLSVTIAIFILLSGMFCFWTGILNKMSKK